MQSIKGQWALVTGASSGFGVEFAQLLAAQGVNLVLTARRVEQMESLATELRSQFGVKVLVHPADLAKPGIGAELKAQLDAKQIAIDILINNAGYGLYGAFVEQPISATLNMLQLNILALTEITHAFAADMVKRRQGHILLVASIGGYQATPTYAAYSASKSYVLLFGEALNTELKDHNVKVSVLSPGITATSFLAVSGQKATAYQRMVMMQPRPVAQIGLKAMFDGVASVVPGLANKITIMSNRFTPRPIQRRVAYQLMKN